MSIVRQLFGHQRMELLKRMWDYKRCDHDNMDLNVFCHSFEFSYARHNGNATKVHPAYRQVEHVDACMRASAYRLNKENMVAFTWYT